MFKPRNFTEIDNEKEINLLDNIEDTDQIIQEIDEGYSDFETDVEVMETTINKDVKIEGSVLCKGKLNLHADLKGDLKCVHELHISSVITGDIQCGMLTLDNCTINGDVVAKGCITCPAGSCINGDVTCDECIVDGIITGNLSCSGNVHAQKNSVIKGDILCGTISILQGANIDGKIIMNKKENI